MYTKIPGAGPRLLSAAALVLAGAAFRPAGAQAPAFGRIEGRLVDSVHAQPPRRTTVQAVRLSPEPRTFASVFTDDKGRFRIDSLLAGHYWLTFDSDLLDSLGVEVPSHEVDVQAGTATQADLAIPSGATLRAAACPGIPLSQGRGALLGVVVDAASERALPGATVVLGWSDWTLDKSTMKVATTPRVASVVTDSLGRYRLCGVPTDIPLHLQVQHAGSASAIVGAQVRDSVGMLRQDLSFGADVTAEARADTGTVRGARLPAATGTAAVTGVVTGTAGTPLADADVRIAGTRTGARSDSLGRFTLGGLPAGTQMLEARRIGYSMTRVPVELRSGRTATQRIQLTRAVSLDSIRVVARRTLYREFERARANNQGWGRFLDESDIERRMPFETADLLRMEPGFHMRGDVLVSSRGSGFDNRACETNVVVDGTQHMDINFVHPSEIAGMELYRSSVGAPPQYDSFCGLVVIWTKRQ